MKVKTIIAIGMALMLCVAFAVPAFAIDTQVTVVNTGDQGPIIKCKWETPDDADAGHVTPGTQVMPVAGTFDPATGATTIGTKEVQFWAVVTHPVSMSLISGVYADVYHPQVVQQDNLSGAVSSSGQWNGSFKYQVELTLWNKLDNAAQVAAFQSAVSQGLVTFGEGYTAADVIEQLLQGEAELYMGTELLMDHQPAGCYSVSYMAASGAMQSALLWNCLIFAELNSFVTDFSSVNYGSVAVGAPKMIGGDTSLATPTMPTVWNNGNVYINLTVMQDDAGFGYRTVNGQKVWNVHWDSRLGHEREGATVNYDPGQRVTIPGLLVMCTPTKMDFSILVDKAPSGATTYQGTMTLGSVVVPFMSTPES